MRRRRRVAAGRDVHDGGLGRAGLGADGPPDDADQIQDRELEDEHQEDDLDHAQILRAEENPVSGPGIT
jgi:hypothetical protein